MVQILVYTNFRERNFPKLHVSDPEIFRLQLLRICDNLKGPWKVQKQKFFQEYPQNGMVSDPKVLIS